RIVVMDKGTVVYDDTPRNVFKHYKELKEMGLGVPQITETMYALKEAGFNVSTDIITIEEAVKEILGC
ncbi:MAG: energy-coupling factor transporter ATPase, partial [Lachnospiraceae bacterium]|nr:energy-coupling factor transporter ATPase [Lachnospiraceae bacterium]